MEKPICTRCKSVLQPGDARHTDRVGTVLWCSRCPTKVWKLTPPDVRLLQSLRISRD